jgi:hypothetical protein
LEMRPELLQIVGAEQIQQPIFERLGRAGHYYRTPKMRRRTMVEVCHLCDAEGRSDCRRPLKLRRSFRCHSRGRWLRAPVTEALQWRVRKAVCTAFPRYIEWQVPRAIGASVADDQSKPLVRKEVRLDKRVDESLHRGTIGHTCQRPGRGSNR